MKTLFIRLILVRGDMLFIVFISGKFKNEYQNEKGVCSRVCVIGTLFFVFPLLLLAGSAEKGIKRSKAENLRTAFLIGV